MRRFVLLVLGAALALAPLSLAGCATTQFQSTWRSPTARPIELTGKRVAAVFMSRNPSTRRVAEDALAAEITKRGGIGVPSYSLIGDTSPANADSTRGLLEASGVAGMLTMRIVGREAQETWVPGRWTTVPAYTTWPQYWGYGWAEVYEPGYLQTDTIVSVETLAYSFVQDGLVWAGMSDTINPSRADELVRELAGKVAGQLEKDGLLAR